MKSVSSGLVYSKSPNAVPPVRNRIPTTIRPTVAIVWNTAACLAPK